MEDNITLADKQNDFLNAALQKLKGIEIGNSTVNEYLTEDDLKEILEANEPIEEAEEKLNDSGAYDVEIIYHSNAMEYLSENDPSLDDSLELAEELGFDLTSLNSETLASILASSKAREDFERDDLETLLNEIKEEWEELTINNEE